MTSKLEKIGVVKFKDGEYEKDGKMVNRYREAGVIFATPHHSNMAIKLNATAFSEEKWLSVFYDEDKKPNFNLDEVTIEN